MEKKEFPKNELLSVKQVAEILGLTPESIRSYIADGRICAQKFGKSWRIHRSALNAFLEEKGLFLIEPDAGSMIGTQRPASSTARPGEF